MVSDLTLGLKGIQLIWGVGEVVCFSLVSFKFEIQLIYLYVCVCVVTQLCLTLCDPMDCNLPGSSVH